jgi:hypothetical protein
MNYPSSLRRYCIEGLCLGALCFLGSQLLMAQSPVLQNTLLPEPAQIHLRRQVHSLHPRTLPLLCLP